MYDRHFVSLAISQLGVRHPYKRLKALGDKQPPAFHAGELISWLYWHVSYRVPKDLDELLVLSRHIRKGTPLQVGDLAFVSAPSGAPSEAYAYIGGGRWVGAVGPVQGVREANTASLRARGARFRRLHHDSAGREITLNPKVDYQLANDAHYWVLAHVPAQIANMLRRESRRGDHPVVVRRTQHAMGKLIGEVAERLP